MPSGSAEQTERLEKEPDSPMQCIKEDSDHWSVEQPESENKASKMGQRATTSGKERVGKLWTTRELGCCCWPCVVVSSLSHARHLVTSWTAWPRPGIVCSSVHWFLKAWVRRDWRHNMGTKGCFLPSHVSLHFLNSFSHWTWDFLYQQIKLGRYTGGKLCESCCEGWCPTAALGAAHVQQWVAQGFSEPLVIGWTTGLPADKLREK